MSTFLRVIIALFILAHGFIHISLSWVPLPKPGEMHTPFFPSGLRPDTDPTWPILRMGLSASLARQVGWYLLLLLTTGFVLSALGFMGVPFLKTIWTPCLAISSILSVIFIASFWHPWLPAGIIIDLLLLVSIVFRYPANLYS